MTPQPTPQPPVWTGPVILTLCIALLALVVAGISLGWQIWSWWRSGPRVHVVRTQALAPTPAGTLLTGIGVQAENSGRLGTEVQQFGFQLPNDRVLTAFEDFIGRPIQLPMPLPPGRSASVEFNAREIRRTLDEFGERGKRVRPFVKTGHGRFTGKRINLRKEIDRMLRGI